MNHFQEHKKKFGLRWLFTGFSQWYDHVKAFTDGPFKLGELCEATKGDCEDAENDVTKRSATDHLTVMTVTHEKNFFGGKNLQSDSIRPFLSSFIFVIIISFLFA